MKLKTQVMTLAAGLLLAVTCVAQVPSGAPAGSTALCKDGTYSSAATKRGACSSHHGVQVWYDSAASATPAASTTGAVPATPAVSTNAAQAPTSPTPTPAYKTGVTPAASATSGGAPGQVWVNMKSKVYHCPGDRWYGKTEEGKYMAEPDASAQGYRPDHGKACSKRN